MAEQTWETAVNQSLVRRLQQRLFQPGVWDQRGASRIVRRHTRFGPDSRLSDRLHRRWQPLEDNISSNVPIVYATPTMPLSDAVRPAEPSTDVTSSHTTHRSVEHTAVLHTTPPPKTGTTRPHVPKPPSAVPTNPPPLDQPSAAAPLPLAAPRSDASLPAKDENSTAAATRSSQSAPIEKQVEASKPTNAAPSTPVIQGRFASAAEGRTQPLTLPDPASQPSGEVATTTTSSDQSRQEQSSTPTTRSSTLSTTPQTKRAASFNIDQDQPLPLVQPATINEGETSRTLGAAQQKSHQPVTPSAETAVRPSTTASQPLPLVQPQPLVNQSTEQDERTMTSISGRAATPSSTASPGFPAARSASAQPLVRPSLPQGAPANALLAATRQLPLAKPSAPQAEPQTAVPPTKRQPQTAHPTEPQPPSWMKKAETGQHKTAVNIDSLVNKVEQQLMQRLAIQRERRGRR